MSAGRQSSAPEEAAREVSFPRSSRDLGGPLKRRVYFIPERLPLGPLGFREGFQRLGQTDDVQVEVIDPAFKRPEYSLDRSVIGPFELLRPSARSCRKRPSARVGIEPARGRQAAGRRGLVRCRPGWRPARPRSAVCRSCGRRSAKNTSTMGQCGLRLGPARPRERPRRAGMRRTPRACA